MNTLHYPHIQRSSYILEEDKFVNNLKRLQHVAQKAEVKIIHALKAHALWPTFPLIKEYLHGATGSSLYEAKLIYKHMGVKSHTYAPVYFENEIDELLSISSHIVFNSINQYEKYKQKAVEAKVSIGLRLNPQCSDAKVLLYDPCRPGSRLGIESLDKLPPMVDGIHVHTLCESTSCALEKVMHALENRFGKFLEQVKWVNFGGGHLITETNYNTKHLITILKDFKKKHNVDIILEPGAASVWQAGFLLAHVMDIVETGGIKTAILDVSFTAHMPDCLEMPYNPEIRNAIHGKSSPFWYNLGGTTCLAGDQIGPYSFDFSLHIGDQVIFEDMIHYTLVKTSTFNGVRHPDVGLLDLNNNYSVLKHYTFDEYEQKLGAV